VITIQNGWRVSKHVHHVVSSIIAPFGPSIEERPPVPTEEERIAERERKRAEKDARRSERRLKARDEGKESEVGSEVEAEKETT
jgi:small subunit ribosomal protein S17